MLNAESPPEFDLTEFRDADRRLKRGRLYVRGGVVLGLGILGIYFLISLGERAIHGGLAMYTWSAVVVALFWLIVVVAALDLPRWFPGATALRVDETGIHLMYPGGGGEDWLWSNRQTRFLIYDFSEDLAWTRSGINYRLDRPRNLLALGMEHRCSIVSAQAAQTILSMARRKGLNVATARSSNLRYGPRVTVHRLSTVAPSVGSRGVLRKDGQP